MVPPFLRRSSRASGPDCNYVQRVIYPSWKTAGAPQLPGILHVTCEGGARADSQDELEGDIDFYETVGHNLCPVENFLKMTTHKNF